jgi:hypothetical protein
MAAMTFAVAYSITIVAALAVVLATRAGRQWLWRTVAPILLVWRSMFWESPLRAVTGRKRADQRKIAAMEHDCGIQQSSGRPWLGCCACALCSKLPRPLPGPAASLFMLEPKQWPPPRLIVTGVKPADQDAWREAYLRKRYDPPVILPKGAAVHSLPIDPATGYPYGLDPPQSDPPAPRPSALPYLPRPR